MGPSSNIISCSPMIQTTISMYASNNIQFVKYKFMFSKSFFLIIMFRHKSLVVRESYFKPLSLILIFSNRNILLTLNNLTYIIKIQLFIFCGVEMSRCLWHRLFQHSLVILYKNCAFSKIHI